MFFMGVEASREEDAAKFRHRLPALHAVQASGLGWGGFSRGRQTAREVPSARCSRNWNLGREPSVGGAKNAAQEPIRYGARGEIPCGVPGGIRYAEPDGIPYVGRGGWPVQIPYGVKGGIPYAVRDGWPVRSFPYGGKAEASDSRCGLERCLRSVPLLDESRARYFCRLHRDPPEWPMGDRLRVPSGPFSQLHLLPDR